MESILAIMQAREPLHRVQHYWNCRSITTLLMRALAAYIPDRDVVDPADKRLNSMIGLCCLSHDRTGEEMAKHLIAMQLKTGKVSKIERAPGYDRTVHI